MRQGNSALNTRGIKTLTNMRHGVIDVGSNSVRLMLSEDGKTLLKTVKTTGLAHGMVDDVLTEEAMERTALAVSFFCKKAKTEHVVDKLYVFATAAVRKAKNRQVFVDKVNAYSGIVVEIISGEEEAKLGYLGALNGKDGGIIDVGGASTEIVIIENGKEIYSKSVYIGGVSVTDKCGQDEKSAEKYILEKSKAFDKIPTSKFYSIGGTATSIASMLLTLNVYDPKKVNGFIITLSMLENLTQKLYCTSIDDRRKIIGLQPERAEIIANGAKILLEVMKIIGVDKIIVSESDNLEGYLINKGKENE